MTVLKLSLLTDPSNFKKGIDASIKELGKFQRSINSLSSGMTKALGAAGIGIGISQVTKLLKNSTKAASEDVKSQALLANALRNTVGANSSAIAGAEKFLQKTQLQTSVLDDELRPALATAVRATGSLAKGQDLLTLALDVSAGTGKDLGSTTKALSKAYAGNYTGLNKLIPGLKLGADFAEKLKVQFKGSALAAANNDPYKRLEVIFNDIMETIGMSLLPALQDFAAYLVSPAGERSLKQIVDLFVSAGKAIANISKFLTENIILIKGVVAALVFVRIAWTLITTAVKIYTLATTGAVAATKLLKYALITTGIGAIIVLVSTLAASWLEANDAQNQYQEDAPDPNVPTINPYQVIIDNENAVRVQAVADTADAIKKALEAKIQGIKQTAEKFRDAIGLAFGTFGKDENSVFNVDVIINKMKRIVEAAKGFAGNLAKLRKAGASENVITEITNMGAAQGNIVAKGLLGSGRLSEYLGLQSQLYQTGAQAGAQQAMAGNATYEINLSGTNVKASDIIREIRILEKKTGRKYLLG